MIKQPLKLQCKKLSLVIGLLGLSLLATGLSASTASATVLCDTRTEPCPVPYGKGTILDSIASLALHSPMGEVKCPTGRFTGSIAGAGGKGASVSGTVERWVAEQWEPKCNATVTVLKKGTFSISSTGEGNGTLTLEGFEITAELSGVHCIWGGSATFPLEGLETEEGALMKGAAEISRTGGKSGALCGSTAEFTANYQFRSTFISSPEPLYVEESPVPTVLCKTATDPCSGGAYGKGTTVELSAKAGSVIDDPLYPVECVSSSIKGEVTNAGGEGATASGTLNTLNFEGCSSAVTILQKGSFSVNAPNEGDGMLTLEGFALTTQPPFGIHCVWGGSVPLPLEGGSMASTGEVELIRVGGLSGIFCGYTVAWTAEFTVTAPEPLYVAES